MRPRQTCETATYATSTIFWMEHGDKDRKLQYTDPKFPTISKREALKSNVFGIVTNIETTIQKSTRDGFGTLGSVAVQWHLETDCSDRDSTSSENIWADCVHPMKWMLSVPPSWRRFPCAKILFPTVIGELLRGFPRGVVSKTKFGVRDHVHLSESTSVRMESMGPHGFP